MDCNEFYKSLTEEQREYLKKRLDALVEVAHNFFDEWEVYDEVRDLIDFIRLVNEAKRISIITGVISDSFIDLLKSDRGRFIKNRDRVISLMEERING
ncbi:hypothetical protein [Veillonella sp. VA137]|uniref:hypothetical protein n=1 Tax=Veillonella sp. VA137 TaxID=741828 RepID=UPI000F8ED232|nr:hypothetical protein [Veillonella sp. VA137]